jgi:TolA-binding protein
MSNSKISKSTKKKPFYCKNCCCGFSKIQYYDSHLASIKHENRVSTENNTLHICSICQKSFSHPSSLYRHRAKCKEKEVKQVKQVDVNDLKTEITELRKKLEDLEKNNTNNQQISTINNTNNNTKIENQQIGKQNNNTKIENNNNIIINCFGNENMDYITDKVILHCMNKIYGSIPLLIEKIHFDPEHPENNNVKIPNKKLPHAKIMNHKKEWQIVKKKDVIDSMIDNGYNLLDEKFQEKSHELADQKQKYFRNFQAKYEDGDKETMKNIKDEVEMLVINNSRK